MTSLSLANAHVQGNLTLQLGFACCGDEFLEQEAGIARLGELQKLWQNLLEHRSAVLCSAMLCTGLQNPGRFVIQSQLRHSALDLV